MNEEGAQQLAKVYDAIHSSTMEMQKLWLTTSVFTWRWWLTVCFAIVPWIVWLVVRKRESTARLMFAGVTVMVLAAFLETIGIIRGYWWYRYHLLPILTANIMWSYSLMPVSIMLLLQWKPNISPLIKAIVYSAIASFIGLRIFEWLGMYHPKQWSNIYSFVITIVIYLIADFVSKRSSLEKL